MPRAARQPNSIIGRRARGTHSPQLASTFGSKAGSMSEPIAPEAPGGVSSPSGYHGQGKGRDGHQATRSAENPQGLSAEPTPPGVIVFRPPPKRPQGLVTYPRFVRQLSPDIERLILPDPTTGEWPRLNPAAVAEPAGGRRAVDWTGRPPSRNAYAAWVRESAPTVKIELELEDVAE